MRGALRQQHGRLRMVHDRNQHRGGADRPFLRDDLQHAVVARIAAYRNNARVVEPGRNLEAQPRAGAVEKFRRTNVRRAGFCLEHWFVHRASLACSASAIAKNSPADATPNMARPSTTRSSPMSTRS